MLNSNLLFDVFIMIMYILNILVLQFVKKKLTKVIWKYNEGIQRIWVICRIFDKYKPTVIV